MSSKLLSSRSLVAILAATTMLGGAAFAADQSSGDQPSMPPGHAKVVKDFGKLSADGVRAYQDLTLARLAIFDGRTADAKKLVDDAASGFDKAKSDESVFQQAEATMRTHMSKTGKSGSDTSGAASADTNGASGTNDMASKASSNQSGSGQNDVNTPIAWLPVDGTVTINEDYSMQPAKAKAVADANQSLAKGDKKGAMDRLKLAEVDTAVTMAVVPLKQTIQDVDQAKQMIDSGKFYEGSQKLRAVQASTVFTITDMPAVPAKGQSGSATSQGNSQTQQPATH